jgi:PDZ/DHR/GLGF domain protein
VVENGPASTALHKGDIIFQANGIEFTSMTKEQAMNVLQSAGNTLSLMISRN